MKYRILCALFAGMLGIGVLAGCSGTAGEEAASAPTEPQITAGAANNEAPAQPGPLPGVNAENYPRVDGSTANMPLMAELYSVICGVSPEEAESYVSASGGTGSVWRSMLYGSADLLLVYEAPESVKEMIEQEGLELEIDPIGCDGLVFLVNRANPVDGLAVEQLRGIYTGDITDWSEVGGEPGPIAAYQRNEESGSQTLFRKLLMGEVQPMEAPSELVPGSMGGLIEDIAAFDGAGGAIGYSVFYYANLMYQNPDLKLLSVDGVAPSAEAIGGGQYPLVNDFYTVIRKDAAADSPARLLRDWLHTEEGRAVLLAADYVPVGG